MRRTLAGTAVGIGIAVLIMIIAEAIGNRMFGLALDPDQALPLTDASLPPGAQLSVVAGWFAGTFLGALAALWISRVAWTAWAVAGAILVGIVARILLSSTPPLMIAGGLAGPLLGAFLAGLLGPRRSTARRD